MRFRWGWRRRAGLLPPARRVSTRRPTRGASARATAQPRREPSGVRGARQPRKELSPWGVRAEPSRGWAERPVEADRLSDVRIQKYPESRNPPTAVSWPIFFLFFFGEAIIYLNIPPLYHTFLSLLNHLRRLW